MPEDPPWYGRHATPTSQSSWPNWRDGGSYEAIDLVLQGAECRLHRVRVRSLSRVAFASAIRFTTRACPSLAWRSPFPLPTGRSSRLPDDPPVGRLHGHGRYLLLGSITPRRRSSASDSSLAASCWVAYLSGATFDSPASAVLVSVGDEPRRAFACPISFLLKDDRHLILPSGSSRGRNSSPNSSISRSSDSIDSPRLSMHKTGQEPDRSRYALI